MIMIFDTTIKTILGQKLEGLEKKFEADVIFYYGEIQPSMVRPFRDLVEELKKPEDASTPHSRLVFILCTAGGLAEVTEKMVEVMRFHYTEVFFVVPDFAMSAGTIFCMSGDKIYMDYSSSLGPIDPQVWNGTQYVPALGYLDKVEELLDKARKNELLNAEFLILQSLDLAMLSRYEQAKNLTITLLKRWLVEYKFRDWNTHQTTPEKVGQPVTQEEKEQSAEEIAKLLGDNKHWHSHARMLGINRLRSEVRLKIEDYSKDAELQPLIRSYNDLITEYIARNGHKFFMHSRNYF
jgi:membrane-bound ClpP family serine protease